MRAVVVARPNAERIDRATADLRGLHLSRVPRAPSHGKDSARASKKREVRFFYYSLTGRYDSPQVHISFALNRCSAMSTNRTAVKPFTC